jgi:rRNA maturation RNase YbeY
VGSKSKVYFFFNKVKVSLKNRSGLKKRIEGIFKEEGKNLESVNYVFCSDKQILKINKEYLKHNFYTDILSFELSEPGAPIFAEIYISIDRVKDNAKRISESIKSELYRVMFHGALHLCGYKDKSKREQIEMKLKEDYYLQKYA